MTTPEQQERLTRWLDGAMTDSEKAAFELELERDPGLRAEAESLAGLGGLVRRHATMEKPVPGGEFFNSQIRDRIAEERRAEARRQARPRGVLAWPAWLRTPWAAGAAAALAVALFVVLRGGAPQTEVTSVYVPNPSVTASVVYHEAAGATVLTLEGLGAFPDQRNISGLKVRRSENDPGHASVTLFDAQDRVLLVMATDSGNRPVVLGKGTEE